MPHPKQASSTPKRRLPTRLISQQINARPRLLMGIVLGTLMYLVTANSPELLRLMMAWDTGVVFFLTLTWWMFSVETVDLVRRRAQAEDEGRWVILGLLALASVVSLVSTALILGGTKDLSSADKTAHVALAIVTIILSWSFMQTVFTLHYAHLFYDRRPDLPDGRFGGLDFPGKTEPDYLDFAYFSFVVGMTFQVSDVEITGRVVRRLALAHGVLAFFYNTVILALAINIAAGLI